MENFKREADSQGTPISSENIVDVLEIQRVIDAQVNEYDNQEWALTRYFMTEEFESNLGQNSISI